MEVRWIWLSAGGAAVIAAAIWALMRPDRQSVLVGSLRLWRQAAETMSNAGQRKTKRVSAAWLLLLAGGMAAVCGMGLRGYHTTVLCRRVCIGLYPTAEVSTPQALAEMKSGATALLERLGPSDRVRLIFPSESGGQSDWMSVAHASDHISSLAPIAISSSQIEPPALDPQVQHTYYFVAAGSPLQSGPATSVIEIDSQLPQLTVDALGAVETGDSQAELLMAIRNESARKWTGMIRVKGCDASGIQQWRTAGRLVGIEPRERKEFIFTVKSSDLLVAMAASAGGKTDDQADASAYLVRRLLSPRKVAITGRDEPLLRHYIRSDRMLTLVENVSEADIVIANQTDPSLVAPCLAINPPTLPDGWRRGGEMESVVLDEVNMSADHRVTRHVDLSKIAVLRMTPWRAGGAYGDSVFRAESIASYKDQAIILIGPEGTSRSKRVYLAFDVFQGDMNLTMDIAFPILLANTMRYLSPPGPTRTVYEYTTPRSAGKLRPWKNLLTPPDNKAQQRGPLLWPGAYGDSEGRAHAINLVGLRGAKAKSDPAKAVAPALPQPAYADRVVAIWPFFLCAAVVLWLAGWAVKMR